MVAKTVKCCYNLFCISIRICLGEIAVTEQKKKKLNIFQNPVVKKTLKIVFVVAVVASLLLNLFTFVMPVVKYYGNSMSPTLSDGQILIVSKVAKIETGDVIAFYYNNKLLVKRVIASSGDWVNIDEEGTVYVNDVRLEEPYLLDKSLESCDIELPYQVPEGKYFLMGDHRATSVDSRHSSVGCIEKDAIVGKIIFRVWPWEMVGLIA